VQKYPQQLLDATTSNNFKTGAGFGARLANKGVK